MTLTTWWIARPSAPVMRSVAVGEAVPCCGSNRTDVVFDWIATRSSARQRTVRSCAAGALHSAAPSPSQRHCATAPVCTT